MNGGRSTLADLFRREAEAQVRVMNDGLLALEQAPHDVAAIEPIMRAAHSLKGAARVVGLDVVVQLAHQMEECFVAVQEGRLRLAPDGIDALLAGVDLIGRVAALGESEATLWQEQHRLTVADVMVHLYDLAEAARATPASPERVTTAPSGFSTPVIDPSLATPSPEQLPASNAPERVPVSGPASQPAVRLGAALTVPGDDPVLRVNARSVDRLVSLANETWLTAHALEPQLHAMRRLKRRQQELHAALDKLQQEIAAHGTRLAGGALGEQTARIRQMLAPLTQALQDQLNDFDTHERRLRAVSSRLLDEVLALRMRPFRDGVQAFPRMVRDLARSLGKEARLDIQGGDTLVNRDVLAQMESPLNHILRNALDHGIELPAQRAAAGKPREALIRIEARHQSGMLNIRVSDDGGGADPERIRAAVRRRGLAPQQMTDKLSVDELLDFLLLPGFSLRDTASEISGRGVGLDVVQTAIRGLNGAIRLATTPGVGFQADIVLPLSQSIARAVIVTIAQEAYAIPIARIERILRVPRDAVHSMEDKQFITVGDDRIGLVGAAQLLAFAPGPADGETLAVVVLGNAQGRYGLVVEAIAGERNLTVHPLEPLFGKLRNVSAASLLDDGTPVLILDTDDLLNSIDAMLREGSLQRLQQPDAGKQAQARRILVVDDSLTVREMQRQLLQTRGYAVTVAVDGVDGWNAVRSGGYALLITDIDMPRMDGIELVARVRQDSRLKDLPVMIVSYKDRPEDRARGLEVGADYYLTKGSFHDDALLQAVTDLIGENLA